MKNRDRKNIMIIALLVTVMFMSVGYSLLSTQLEIKGTSTIVDPVWDVNIASISSTETTGHGKSISATIENKFSAKFNNEFVMPGDRVTYVINVKNEGTLNAKLNSITIEPESKKNDAIIYTIEGLEAGELLPRGETKMFTLTAEYNPEYTEEVEKEDLTKEITLLLDYVQE